MALSATLKSAKESEELSSICMGASSGSESETVWWMKFRNSRQRTPGVQVSGRDGMRSLNHGTWAAKEMGTHGLHGCVHGLLPLLSNVESRVCEFHLGLGKMRTCCLLFVERRRQRWESVPLES